MSVRELLAERAKIALDLNEDVPSPCISVCRMDAASGLCEGCFRSLDEIAAWSRMSDAQKRIVWPLILQRASLPEATP